MSIELLEDGTRPGAARAFHGLALKARNPIGCLLLNRRSRPRSLDELLGGIVQNAALTPLGAVNIE